MKTIIEFNYSVGDEVWIKELERKAKIISLWYTLMGKKYQCRWADQGKFQEEYLFEDEISHKKS